MNEKQLEKIARKYVIPLRTKNYNKDDVYKIFLRKINKSTLTAPQVEIEVKDINEINKDNMHNYYLKTNKMMHDMCERRVTNWNDEMDEEKGGWNLVDFLLSNQVKWVWCLYHFIKVTKDDSPIQRIEVKR